jgi:hypothetical protein
MQTSEITDAISSAIAMAQAEMNPAPKDSMNPHFKSRYADLASCKEAAKPALAKHGLAVIQTIKTDFDQQAVGVVTRMTHKSGQWYEDVTWCKPRDLGPQSVGAAATYLRRYGFSAITGLVSEEDDDGNNAQGVQQKPQQTKTQAGVYNGSTDQKKIITDTLTKAKIPENQWDSVFERMLGRPSTYLNELLKEYR